MPRGVFISFEGGEASGKTTQIRLLQDRLRTAGRTVISVREPGGTPLGEKIRHLLKHDLDGKVVNQGIAVYGNKGSTDQHAYVQQLRDGVNNFFATFIEVGKARSGASIEVDPGFTSGDYLQGFLRGTRKALAESGRESITLNVTEVDAFHLGLLVGLFERAVSFYASLVNVNAYHQPGVEAGKKAAGEFLALLGKVCGALSASPQTAEGIAASLGADAEDVFHCLNHLASNGKAVVTLGSNPAADQFVAV